MHYLFVAYSYFLKLYFSILYLPSIMSFSLIFDEIKSSTEVSNILFPSKIHGVCGSSLEYLLYRPAMGEKQNI